MKKTSSAGDWNSIFHTGINHQYEPCSLFVIPPRLFVSAWNFCFELFAA